jgi:hypothetical protein
MWMAAFLRGLVQTTSQTFTVNGNDFTCGQGGQIGYSTGEAIPKQFRINGGEDGAQGIMGRDAVDQSELLGEPVFFRDAEFFDFNPVVSATDDGAEGDKKDVLQLMLLLAINSRIWNT